MLPDPHKTPTNTFNPLLSTLSIKSTENTKLMLNAVSEMLKNELDNLKVVPDLKGTELDRSPNNPWKIAVLKLNKYIADHPSVVPILKAFFIIDICLMIIGRFLVS